MKIKSLKYAEPRGSGWSLDVLNLKDGINLFVGASGSGKTRVLNIIFNIGTSATQDRLFNGEWTVQFEHSGVTYTWQYEGVSPDDREGPEGRVLSERLWIGSPDQVETSLFSRTETEFSLDSKQVPKLGKTSTGIYLLREEDTIKPAHEAFSRIMRRRFWSDDLENSTNLTPIPLPLIRKLEKRADMLQMFRAPGSLHVVLYLLRRYFREQYTSICDHFKRVFPFVEDIEIGTAAATLNVPLSTDIPMALIKERGIKKPVQLNEIASGMQKVLLIITDVVTAPPDVLYMIDEYENSLGVNAIDFLPPFLAEVGGTRQFIITTHHPLLINAIPVADWFVFHRKGLNIKVTHGHEIESRYGRSKQQRFTQLINDPLYTEGVE